MLHTRHSPRSLLGRASSLEPVIQHLRVSLHPGLVLLLGAQFSVATRGSYLMSSGQALNAPRCPPRRPHAGAFWPGAVWASRPQRPGMLGWVTMCAGWGRSPVYTQGGQHPRLLPTERSTTRPLPTPTSDRDPGPLATPLCSEILSVFPSSILVLSRNVFPPCGHRIWLADAKIPLRKNFVYLFIKMPFSFDGSISDQNPLSFIEKTRLGLGQSSGIEGLPRKKENQFMA